jgi:hypothetical protein
MRRRYTIIKLFFFSKHEARHKAHMQGLRAGTVSHCAACSICHSEGKRRQNEEQMQHDSGCESLPLPAVWSRDMRES